ncbi:hypothetical protein NDU88_002279 [Pleurodeles waltl]|uniref:Uncharacterized protein n=1 Tax=Pleurodeles waltl TaxID=8319 RepID=A0AAV7SCG9_PLEWA|nr:hypothetical protein NDU88_002279 [Pleurodeles waltl]
MAVAESRSSRPGSPQDYNPVQLGAKTLPRNRSRDWGSGFQTPGEVLTLQKETEENWAHGVRTTTGCDAARIVAMGRLFVTEKEYLADAEIPGVMNLVR